MSLVLDCENYETSVKCLAEFYEAKVSDVEKFLSAIDLDEEYRTKDVSMRGDEFLLHAFQSNFGRPARAWNKVCWFHLTRVPPNTDFAEGILPLQMALGKIWKHLVSRQTSKRKRAILERLRNLGVPDFQYQLKTGSTLHGGPYAMLVKEAAFHSTGIGNHDYLRIPEIIEDICNGYKKHSGESIYDEVVKTLKPCIVKFEGRDSEDDPHLTRTLLYYCWSKCRSEELCYLANTCLDARGKVVPPSAILKVEYL